MHDFYSSFCAVLLLNSKEFVHGIKLQIEQFLGAGNCWLNFSVIDKIMLAVFLFFSWVINTIYLSVIALISVFFFFGCSHLVLSVPGLRSEYS